MAVRKNATIQTEEVRNRLTALEDNIHALVGVCKQQSDVIQPEFASWKRETGAERSSGFAITA